MTLKKLWREFVKFCKPKRQRVVHASRSRLTLNETESLFVWYIASEATLKQACESVRISARVGKLWLKKPKIMEAIERFGGLPAGHSPMAANVIYSEQPCKPLGDVLFGDGFSGPRIPPAENDPRDGA